VYRASHHNNPRQNHSRVAAFILERVRTWEYHIIIDHSPVGVRVSLAHHRSRSGFSVNQDWNLCSSFSCAMSSPNGVA